MENKWIDFDIEKPDMKEEIEVSYDGKNVDDTVSWIETRSCMMAGIAGGFGYFGPGWGTNENSKANYGLICDHPTHWRYKI